MRSFLPPIAAAMAAFLLALGLFVRRQSQVIDQLRQHIVQAQAVADKQMAAQLEVARGQEHQLREATDKIAQLNRELEVARAAAGVEPPRDRTAEDPGLLAFRQRQLRRLVQERYGDLFERLNLSPDTLEHFKQLLVELLDARSRDRTTAPDATPAEAPGSGEAAFAVQRTPADLETEVHALLGDADYEIYDEFNRELTRVRPEVSRFASDAADAGQPLTAVQRTALSRLIFEATDPHLNPAVDAPGANDPDPATALTPIDQLILTRATDVLSPAQLDVLRTFRIHEREGLAVWRKQLESPSERTPAAPSAAPQP